MTQPLDEAYRDESGTITLCMHCGRARRPAPGSAQWEVVTEFQERTPRGVSHGLCPECLEKHYPRKET